VTGGVPWAGAPGHQSTALMETNTDHCIRNELGTRRNRNVHGHHHDHDHGGVLDTVLYWLALAAFGWLAVGVAIYVLT
jgi:hypothetical protein